MGFRNPTKIPPGSVGVAELADGSVTGPKISVGALDGKIITGALIRSAATGQRWEQDSVLYNEIRGYSGHANEIDPARITVGVTSGTPTPFLSLASPDRGFLGGASVSLLASTGAAVNPLIQTSGDVSVANGRIYTSGERGWHTATLINGWATLGAGWPHPRYRLDPDGYIFVFGACTGGSAGLAMFALTGMPAPAFQMPIIAEAGGAFARLTVTTSGNVLHSVGGTASVLFQGRVPTFST